MSDDALGAGLPPHGAEGQWLGFDADGNAYILRWLPQRDAWGGCGFDANTRTSDGGYVAARLRGSRRQGRLYRPIQGDLAMSTHRSKPVEIEAFQLEVPPPAAAGYPAWFDIELAALRAVVTGDRPGMWITTANGPVRADVGDWIIREPSGIGCYPCKPGVFEAKYEAI